MARTPFRFRVCTLLFVTALLGLGCGTGPVDPTPPDTDDDAGRDESEVDAGPDGEDGSDGEPETRDGEQDGSDGTPGDGGAGDGQDDGDDGEYPPEPPTTSVPALGTASSLDIGSWNIEWFGDENNGPSNLGKQAENAREVLLGCAMDIWGLAEIVDADLFAEQVTAKMPGYKAVLANGVPGGSAYSTYEQKVGLLYREAIATLESAEVVLGSEANAFGGRPPLEAHFQVKIGDHTEPLIVLVIHAKALADAQSWQRRSEGAAALKDYLDTTYPDQAVMVIGDFNDTLNGSISTGRSSPYAAFVSDADAYSFPSSEVEGGSTVGRDTVIDHHLITNELTPRYLPDTAQAYRVDRYLANFATTTSNHYPVVSSYSW